MKTGFGRSEWQEAGWCGKRPPKTRHMAGPSEAKAHYKNHALRHLASFEILVGIRFNFEIQRMQDKQPGVSAHGRPKLGKGALQKPRPAPPRGGAGAAHAPLGVGFCLRLCLAWAGHVQEVSRSPFSRYHEASGA